MLVSEVMLAQTQAARVVPKWEAFIRRWPTPAGCAASEPGEVIAMWNGLGYNRRALYLHRTATAIVVDHHGEFPKDLKSLRALPGVGPYTARAVLAFAFDEPVGVVDTNIARVLARAVAGRTLRPVEVQRLADGAVPGRTGWAWNQAMLDLGATTCTARQPKCNDCPLGPNSADQCRWARTGNKAPDPAVGSARVSKPQSRFHGSDRQGRGRIVAHLTSTARPISPGQLPGIAGWPDDPERASAVAATLLADGLVTADADGRLALP